MKLIVGLGNPGPDYARTRHNAGFMVVDRLQRKHAPAETPKARFQGVGVEASIAGERCLLLKPTTYMNRSGQCVAEAVRFFKTEITDLLVIVDELYLPVGRISLKPGGGTAGHNGLASIQQLLGTDAYPRLRVGVGVQPQGGKPAGWDQANFVLGRFTDEEEPLLEGSLTKSVEAVEAFAAKGLSHAMNAANASEPKPRPPKAAPPKPEPAPGDAKAGRPESPAA